MARGRDQLHARLQAIQKLGRNLARRSRSNCEMCGTGGVLRVTEVAPIPEYPNEDSAILACDSCLSQMAAKKLDPVALRFLEQTAWSEVMPVQLAAIQLLHRLRRQEVSWAIECLDGLWIDDAIQAKLDPIK